MKHTEKKTWDEGRREQKDFFADFWLIKQAKQNKKVTPRNIFRSKKGFHFRLSEFALKAGKFLKRKWF